jgi:class 3 adenylate cyclase
MASIAKNYGAKIIKNAGDCLIYYFSDTSDKSNPQSFRNVLDCSTTMVSAHRVINARLLEEKLPSLNYRISADYEVEFARMQSSKTDDLFGAAMNKCAKINSKAPANGIVIGEEFFKIIRPLEDKYSLQFSKLLVVQARRKIQEPIFDNQKLLYDALQIQNTVMTSNRSIFGLRRQQDLG